MNGEKRKLPVMRRSITHKAVIQTVPEKCPECGKEISSRRVKFFFTVGLFDDGKPGELFMHMDCSGSTLDGFAKCFGLAISLCLQQGVSLEYLVGKFRRQQFEPRGFTENPNMRTAASIVDYVIGWMENEFLKGKDEGSGTSDTAAAESC